METIAAIPGLVESVYMHFTRVSLLTRDKGWIYHMLYLGVINKLNIKCHF